MWPCWDLGLREAPELIEGEVQIRATVVVIPSHSSNTLAPGSLYHKLSHFHGFQCPCLSVIQLYWAQYLLYNKYFKFYNIQCYAPFYHFEMNDIDIL